MARRLWHPSSLLPANGPAGRLAGVALAALLTLAAAVAHPAAAQENGPPSDPPPGTPSSTPAATRPADATDSNENPIFFESLAVNVVNVDVYVTDKDDKPVTGLTKDDFELLEDGRPVEITNFYAVDGEPTTAGRAEMLADLPTDGREVPDFIRKNTRPPEQQLHLIVYVDNLFISPFSRNNLIREVNRFLTLHMQPGDKVMLVSFDRTLNVRQPFTTDVRLIGRAMDELMTVRAYGEQAKQDRRDLIHRIDDAQSVAEAMSHADFYAKNMFHDVETSLRGMDELVSSLGGLPGRKAFLYVSEGVPMTAGEDLFALVDLKFGERSSSQLSAHRYRVRRQFRSLVARANSNRVTFYTLDASGAYTYTGISAEYGNSTQSYSEMDFVYDSNRQEPLMMMAEGTGGQSVLGTANFGDALERIATDLTTYYSLGYQPVHAEDGRYHDIQVRVKKKGLQVRYRQGYRAKTAESRLDDGTMAALLYDASVNPLSVKVIFGDAQADGRGNYLLPVEVQIPLDEIALLPQGTARRGQMRVSLSVMDSDGDTSPPTQNAFPIVVPEDDLKQEGRHYTYAAQLLMRSGVQRVGVGVVDEIGGESSFLSRSVRVGS
jgi:VWFA-related protein